MEEVKAKIIKAFVGGAVVGMVVLLIVGFATGWVTTSGSAQDKAEEMAKQAVIDQLAPICVEQFLQDPNWRERLKELEAKGYWERSKDIEESGWAIMPGAESAAPGVAHECYNRLFELIK